MSQADTKTITSTPPAGAEGNVIDLAGYLRRREQASEARLVSLIFEVGAAWAAKRAEDLSSRVPPTEGAA